ncbi:transmembrane protease serine 7 isoform X2 [Leguminivora glycinivorella]|uniref:transmembrane protease serine 7 isoform X2 n=1 Tax=Leguminivora glycinivorella TaxID=1035111 RepID=UPI00200BBB8A|nr:transmembrane protease serine 7 isoform X2 [Leguminivora glycinivorella]
MLSEKWKVILILATSVVAGESSRALSLVRNPYSPIFIPKYKPKRSRVLFLDDHENYQPVGRGEIDLTVEKVNSKIKFDDASDYDFTSPDKAELSGNERFYEPRLHPFQYPLYQGRFGRYAPNFEPTVPYAPFAPAVRNFYNTGWKARSPRVVFPYSDVNAVHTNSHAGPAFNDNVVFRDSLNDVGENELALQEDNSGDAFAERDANDHEALVQRMDFKKRTLSKPMFVQTEIKRPYKRNYISNSTEILPEFKPITDEQMARMRDILKDISTKTVPVTSTIRKGRILTDSIEPQKEDRQDEKNCSQGGTCEFFFYCWMVGGLLEGSCGGLLKGCCHRVAKAGILGVQDSNSIEFSGESYGPVINDESCGIAVGKQTAQRRIVGGDDAGFGTFPWQAYIRIGSSRCGGSLISRRHVVTAGHCVARAQPRHVRVTLGDYVINSAAEPLPAYTFGVRGIKVHPLFKFTPQADRFDVAVLTLDRNVHYMPHIAPICLPERGSDFLGQYGWAAGWGALSPGSRLRPRTLQAVDVPVLDNRVCERWHRANGINVVIYPEMLCAGYRGGGKDSCQGDSGGPLMLERAGRWYLIGVVSAGYSCASRGQPGIYHRVAHTVDWISHATTLS